MTQGARRARGLPFAAKEPALRSAARPEPARGSSDVAPTTIGFAGERSTHDGAGSSMWDSQSGPAVSRGDEPCGVTGWAGVSLGRSSPGRGVEPDRIGGA